MKPFLVICGFWGAVLLGAWIWINMDANPPPGRIAPDEPRQVEILERTWDRGDARFTALAQFDIRARVLSKNRYHFDPEADLSPLDLALGWGPMSDSRIVDEFSISQSQRFYFWRPKWGHNPPIPIPEVISHSANMHMIPANDGVMRTLFDVRVGELISLSGYLVQVNRPTGWKWRSSLSRTDTGAGACEVVWVDRAKREQVAE
jgi:hypothetical protein